MRSVTEITDVFAALASYVEVSNHISSVVTEDEEKSLDLAISKLNRSLNLDGETDDPTVHFLNTALSSMCFTASQVFDSAIERLAKAIVVALSSSVSCKLHKFQNAEVLQIGSSISERDCRELTEACTVALVRLSGNGTCSHLLLDAIIRASFAASRCQYLFPACPVLDGNPVRCNSSSALILLNHLPRESCLNKDEIPLRLLLWYMDPLVLKHDVSDILRETMERPFLCLDQELHERTEWRMIIICLMLCPIMFIEARAMLHNWFLETGAASILELLTNLVAVMLDVSFRPTWWSISSELGLKLPFSGAYYSFKHHLYRILSGPITSTSFSDVVHSSCSDSVTLARATKLAVVDHKSAWALAITFPTWYYYACISLFCGHAFEDINWKSEIVYNVEPLPSSTSAAMYIAWVLDPINETQQKLIVDFLTRSSESWIHQQSASCGTEQETTVSRKKFKKLNFCNNMKNTSLRNNLQSTLSWLEKFDIGDTFWPQNPGPRQQRSTMYQKIPLGILLGWPGDLNGCVCELLLYYAATGRILQPKETRCMGTKDLKNDCPGIQDSASWIEECDREDVVTGARLVFRLTDIVESMSGSLFQTEESRINFICKFKERAYAFLVKCINRLMSKLYTFDYGPTMLSDLHSRLSRWKNEGLVSDWKDLDDIIARLSQKISAT
ncbi:hypothetical protein SAY86_026725 [Trapa natans]|uniref:Uncharacterized protein n=1 Tax=Trapa natans TaxID=22666 RepID=A0AAN7QI23_TRANT|nr:hypothetical protein SAY86_026725 [Trapa natans]